MIPIVILFKFMDDLIYDVLISIDYFSLFILAYPDVYGFELGSRVILDVHQVVPVAHSVHC